MKLYHLDDGDNASWHGSLRAAQLDGQRTASVFRGAIRLTECRISLAKPGVLNILNGQGPTVLARGRVWKLSARGGLRLL